MKKKIGIGLIGSGFMGRAHAQAYRAVSGIFAVPRQRNSQWRKTILPVQSPFVLICWLLASIRAGRSAVWIQDEEPAKVEPAKVSFGN